MKLIWLFILAFCVFSAIASFFEVFRRLLSFRTINKDIKRVVGFQDMKRHFSDQARQEAIKCLFALAILIGCLLAAYLCWTKVVRTMFFAGH